MGGTVIQTEDELSAIGAVIGASFAGERAMTATSGPGALAHDGDARAGLDGGNSFRHRRRAARRARRRATPRRREQSDLWHSLYGTHGDAPRVVLACSDVEDAFHATVEAFNIAEEYQIPVILLSDQSIGQRRQTISGSALEHEVVGRTAAVRRGAPGLPALSGHGRRGLPDERAGDPGRRISDERPRARRLRPSGLRVSDAREP